MLIKFQFVNHPPGHARPRRWQGPKDKDDDRCSHQCRSCFRSEFTGQFDQQESDNTEGAKKDDLLIISVITEAHAEGEDHKCKTAAQNPPVGSGNFNQFCPLLPDRFFTQTAGQLSALITMLNDCREDDTQH